MRLHQQDADAVAGIGMARIQLERLSIGAFRGGRIALGTPRVSKVRPERRGGGLARDRLLDDESAVLAELEHQVGRPIRLQVEALYGFDQYDVVLA